VPNRLFFSRAVQRTRYTRQSFSCDSSVVLAFSDLRLLSNEIMNPEQSLGRPSYSSIVGSRNADHFAFCAHRFAIAAIYTDLILPTRKKRCLRGN
jgi:hypothetical protein